MSRLLVAALTAAFLGSAWASARAESVAAAPGVASFPTTSATAALQDALPSGAPPVIDLPQMGEPADTALSPVQEQALGGQVVSEMLRYEYVLEDPELSDYVTTLGWKLAAASGAHPSGLQFFFVKDPRINAFALPGGFIGLNAGTIIASDDESELAGVLSHELAHVTQRHIARSAAQSGGLGTIATWAAVLAAIIAGSADPDVVLAALSIGQAASYQRQVAYTRASELEADRIGIGTMSEAGFDPDGMAAFFQKLEQQSRLYGSGVPEILLTHPVNTTRMAEARARAANLPQRKVADSIEYQLMKARTQVFAADQPSDAVDAFAAIIASGRDTPANRYGMAMALHELGQDERAIKALGPVIEKYPKQPNVAMLQATLQIALHDTAGGLATYQRTLALYPRLTPAILNYADALINAGKPEEARQILISHEQPQGTELDTYRLLAQAAREMDNDAEASYQMANFLYLRGDPGGALSQLDAGLRIASLSAQDRARLSARRAEVRESLPRNFDPDRRERQQRY